MKKLILLIACAVLLNANLNTKIKNIIGPSAYNTHKNLINLSFANKSSVYTNGQVDYVKLTSKLQANGLLKLRYKSPRYINVNFYINGNSTKTIKNLKDILKSMGHYYYFTQESKTNDSKSVWSIKLKTAAAINPLGLSKRLSMTNSKVTNIRKEGTYNWSYSINSRYSSVYKAHDLNSTNTLNLKKSLRPYMIKVSNANGVNIQSKPGNSWHPSIVFYNNDLEVIDIYKDESLQKNLRVEVPLETKYIKIDDLYSLSNMKRGITITKE